MASPFTKSLNGTQLTVHHQASPDYTHRLLLTENREFSAMDHADTFGLTRRESEVLHWIVEGKTNPEIAILLATSTRTIHKHVERILHKLGVPNRSAAVREVLQRARSANP